MNWFWIVGNGLNFTCWFCSLRAQVHKDYAGADGVYVECVPSLNFSNVLAIFRGFSLGRGSGIFSTFYCFWFSKLALNSVELRLTAIFVVQCIMILSYCAALATFPEHYWTCTLCFGAPFAYICIQQIYIDHDDPCPKHAASPWGRFEKFCVNIKLRYNWQVPLLEFILGLLGLHH